MSPISSYAELHCLSNFTFLTGASHPEELVRCAHELSYSAMAITDECSLAGIVRAHTEAKECGLRLITGSEIRLASGPRLVLLAQSRDGYGNLAELITLGRRRAQKGGYRLERADLGAGLADCLALWLPDAEPDVEDGRWLAGCFPGCCWIAVELHRSGGDGEWLERLRLLSRETRLPLIATGGVLMHTRERRPLQDTLTAIRLGVPVAQAGFHLQPNGERHLRTLASLARFYPPDLLAETLRVAERCRFSLDELRYEYPDELVPEGETPAGWLRCLTEQGLRRRWPQGTPDRVRGLIEKELALIAALGYEPFFLTVHDIVCFARGRGILCQGRGSAANSAVCYALGITEVDPARMDMLFERFISKERDEPPDIDVDFEHQRREEVLQYVYGKYGRHRAALAASVISYRPKSAVRDVGKALGLELDQVDRLAKNITWWDGQVVAAERLREAGFDPRNPLILRTMRLVHQILGFPRHLSQHVGGMVISRGPLSRLVPIENAAMQDRTVIQWDKDDLEALGLLKVDCLALGMLSAIRRAFDLINGYFGWGEKGGDSAVGRRCAQSDLQQPLGMHNIPAEDSEVYAMIQRAETVGVFQIESRAQMSMLPRLKPARFYDLVIEVAIVRPGPIQGDMVHPYLRRRQGLEPVTYPSEAVREVLGRTLGVPIFQEQVIKVAMVAADFSPGEADQLRRSIAAWRRRGTLEQFEQRLVDGMLERGYEEAFARQIYRQILGFGEYGFPESHAASFALLVYVSAWLKHHFPAAFFAALLNSQPMGFYAPAQLVREARRQGVAVWPPDIRRSGWDCTLERSSALSDPVPCIPPAEQSRRFERQAVVSFPSSRPDPSPGGRGALAAATHSGRALAGIEAPALRLGLRLIKGLSRQGVERLIQARGERPFASVEDLVRRTGLGTRDLRALAAADALRGLAGNRHQAVWQVAGVGTLPPLFCGSGFSHDTAGAFDAENAGDDALALLPVPTEGSDIVADYASIGLSLRRHPLALLRERLRLLGLASAREVGERKHGEWVRAGGLVINRQRPDSANSVTFVTLEDETGQLNLVVWKRLAERQRGVLLGARLLGVVGEVQRESGVVHLIAKRLEDHSVLLGGLTTRSRDFR
jgi:error-prone DNA polymerase